MERMNLGGSVSHEFIKGNKQELYKSLNFLCGDIEISPVNDLIVPMMLMQVIYQEISKGRVEVSVGNPSDLVETIVKTYDLYTGDNSSSTVSDLLAKTCRFEYSFIEMFALKEFKSFGLDLRLVIDEGGTDEAYCSVRDKVLNNFKYLLNARW